MTRERARKRGRRTKTVDPKHDHLTVPDALNEFEEDRKALTAAERDVVRRLREMRRNSIDTGPRAGQNPAYIWSDGLSED